MRVRLSAECVRSQLVQKIEELSGQNVLACNQCGKCSSGCPMVASMDLLPNQVIRLLQLGQVEEVLKCKAIWLCASCFNCQVHCPQGIDLCRVMEALRIISLRRGQDAIDLSLIKPEMFEEAPQQLFVSAMRKLLS